MPDPPYTVLAVPRPPATIPVVIDPEWLTAELRKLVQAHVEKQLPLSVKTAMEAALRSEVNQAVRVYFEGPVNQATMLAMIEKWLADNQEEYISTLARQMTEQAVGEVRRRMLGRDEKK